MFCAECQRTLVYKNYLLADDQQKILCFACLQGHLESEEICWVCTKKSRSRYNLAVNFVKLNVSLLIKLCSRACHEYEAKHLEELHEARGCMELYRECAFCGTKGRNLHACPKCKIFFYCNEQCLKIDYPVHRRRCRS